MSSTGSGPVSASRHRRCRECWRSGLADDDGTPENAGCWRPPGIQKESALLLPTWMFAWRVQLRISQCCDQAQFQGRKLVYDFKIGQWENNWFWLFSADPLFRVFSPSKLYAGVSDKNKLQKLVNICSKITGQQQSSFAIMFMTDKFCKTNFKRWYSFSVFRVWSCTVIK